MNTPINPDPTSNHDQTTQLAPKAFWMFVKKYAIKPKEAAFLMGFPTDHPELGDPHRLAKTIPHSEDMFRKVGLLISIHRTLEQMYSFSPPFRYGLMHMPWSKLEWKAPMEYLMEDPSQVIGRLEQIDSLLRQGLAEIPKE